MQRNKIYFIDEDAAARRANLRYLRALLDDDTLEFESMEPLKTFSQYNDLISRPSTAAFILDQRMKGSGLVNYQGIDLARHLRGIDGKMPIYILTGHPGEEADFAGSEHLVEYIIGKDEIENVNSNQAKIVKARILRHINVFNDVRDEQEQRFHDLIVKSMNGQLTASEIDEMNKIEGITTAPVVAAERARENDLGSKIEQLKVVLQNLNTKGN
jgi:DNA-binding LytR/AlgR family response regulator